MITDVKLYDCQCAVDYYELDEDGNRDERRGSNLIYTDDNYYLVEWCEEGFNVSITRQEFHTLDEALKFYKMLKAQEGK